MRKQPTIERTPTTTAVTSPTGLLTVLSVSPIEEDHLSLQAIIGHSPSVMFSACDLVSAAHLLQHQEIAVLLCERELLSGTWIDVLEHIKALPDAPSLIVASRLADERLWAEALNLGAWDVLAKPFDRTEVIRSVNSAWQHWNDQAHKRATSVKVMTAAS